MINNNYKYADIYKTLDQAYKSNLSMKNGWYDEEIIKKFKGLTI